MARQRYQSIKHSSSWHLIKVCRSQIARNISVHKLHNSFEIQFRFIQFDSIHFTSFRSYHQNNAIFPSIRFVDRKSRFFTGFLHAVRFPSIGEFLLTSKKTTSGSSEKQTIVSRLSDWMSDNLKPRWSKRRKCHFIFVSKAKSDIIALKMISKNRISLHILPVDQYRQHEIAVSRWNKSCNLNVVIISFSIEYQHEE